ncbi:hypothetical protein TcCL_ESM09433 [Trypanosoma cruzi]|nr:hypothetical protein TcCL_ESM09433 [Trypanosoma cruzi]
MGAVSTCRKCQDLKQRRKEFRRGCRLPRLTCVVSFVRWRSNETVVAVPASHTRANGLLKEHPAEGMQLAAQTIPSLANVPTAAVLARRRSPSSLSPVRHPRMEENTLHNWCHQLPPNNEEDSQPREKAPKVAFNVSQTMHVIFCSRVHCNSPQLPGASSFFVDPNRIVHLELLGSSTGSHNRVRPARVAIRLHHVTAHCCATE